MRRSLVVKKLIKNLLIYGSLFIGLSLVIDWYRKPNAPTNFAEQVLYDLEQQPKIIAQLSYEKPMLLYFWGSWCGFCEYTSPAIQQIAQEGNELLTIALKSGSTQEVKDYLDKHHYSFTTINDPTGAFSKSWDIQATPTILIIKQGKIHHHTTGLTSYWGLKFRLWLAN